MEENTDFVKRLFEMDCGQKLQFESLTFEELFNLKYPAGWKKNLRLQFSWMDYEITAHLKGDLEKGGHSYRKGEQVVVWMVSRFGDFGIRSLGSETRGYDVRGIEDYQLENWEILKVK
jgi:hypothetical protein